MVVGGGVQLTFHGQTDLEPLEAVENVGFGNGMDAVVANAADDRTLPNVEDHIFVIGAVGRIFDAELHVFEELGIPQRLKIAPQRLFVVGIALAAEDAGFQRVAAYATLADKDDAIDYRTGLLRRRLLK